MRAEKNLRDRPRHGRKKQERMSMEDREERMRNENTGEGHSPRVGGRRGGPGGSKIEKN